MAVGSTIVTDAVYGRISDLKDDLEGRGRVNFGRSLWVKLDADWQLTPTLQKSEAFSLCVSKGEAVVDLLRSLDSTKAGRLRLSRRVKDGL